MVAAILQQAGTISIKEQHMNFIETARRDFLATGSSGIGAMALGSKVPSEIRALPGVTCLTEVILVLLGE